MSGILIIVAGGFREYGSDAAEIRAIKMSLWNPQTADFEATAHFTPGARILSARTPEAFFGALQNVGAATRIIFIGHGSSGHGLGLMGSAAVWDQAIDVAELLGWRTTIRSRIRPKLRGKTLDLFTCYTGRALEGMLPFGKRMAQELGITIRAFSGPMKWWVAHDGKKITSRGLVCGEPGCKKQRMIRGAHRVTPPRVFRP